MGTHQTHIMLGLFKDFGKKATDLNKKELFDSGFDKKATVKSSSGNVKFEGFTTDKGKTEIDSKAVYTVEATAFKVMDGLDSKLIFETPASGAKNSSAFFSSVSLGSEYATADINSSSALKIKFDTDKNPDGAAFEVNGWELSSKNAFKVADDLSVGFGVSGITQVTKDEKSSISIPDIKLASTYNCGDMLLMAAVTGSFQGELKPGALSSSLFQQVNKETAIAAELCYCSGNVFEAKFGASHSLSDTTTLKTKLTSKSGSNGASMDLAWVQKLGGNSSVTFSKGSGAGDFSLAFTLDA